MKTIGRAGRDRVITSATAAAGVLCAALAACGGSEDAVAVVLVGGEHVAAASAATSVQLEGCVIDQHWAPRGGSPVRVLSADGRLVGDATSDAMGLFRLTVPARQLLTVRLEGPDGEVLFVTTRHEDFSVGTCLQHARS